MLAPIACPRLACRRAHHRAVFALRELIALHRVVEKIGEIRDQRQLGADRVNIDVAVHVAVGLAPLAGQAVAARLSAIARIDGAEAVDQAALHGTLRDLVGRIPVGRVTHRRDVEAVAERTLRVAQHAVQLVKFLRVVPRAVGVGVFKPVDDSPRAHLRRTCEQRALVAILAAGQAGDCRGQLLGVTDARRADGCKVAVFRKVRPLVVLHARNQFGNQEIQVGVALAVRVGRHVDRHARDPRCEIGAVIEVVAAQEILVRLAVAGMLGNDHAGHGFENFARAEVRACFDLLA